MKRLVLGNRNIAKRLDHTKREADFGFGADSSRREVLRGLAMAGAGVCLPAGKLLARAGMSGPAASAGRIDVHTHTVPPFYTKVMEKEIMATGHPLPSWSPAEAIETMDKTGVATS